MNSFICRDVTVDAMSHTTYGCNNRIIIKPMSRQSRLHDHNDAYLLGHTQTKEKLSENVFLQSLFQNLFLGDVESKTYSE